LNVLGLLQRTRSALWTKLGDGAQRLPAATLTGNGTGGINAVVADVGSLNLKVTGVAISQECPARIDKLSQRQEPAIARIEKTELHDRRSHQASNRCRPPSTPMVSLIHRIFFLN
jgi:hypothetical protein